MANRIIKRVVMFTTSITVFNEPRRQSSDKESKQTILGVVSLGTVLVMLTSITVPLVWMNIYLFIFSLLIR